MQANKYLFLHDAKMEFIVIQGKQILILQILRKSVINTMQTASRTSYIWTRFLVSLIFHIKAVLYLTENYGNNL